MAENRYNINTRDMEPVDKVPLHGETHKLGGTDEVGTETPGAGEIPYADILGKLDAWITARKLVPEPGAPTSPKRYLDDTLAWSVPTSGGGGGLGGLLYVGRSEATASQADLPFTGLDPTSRMPYLAFVNMKNATGAGVGLHLEVDADTTQSHYERQTLVASDTSRTSDRAAVAAEGATDSGDCFGGLWFIYVDIDGKPRATGINNRNDVAGLSAELRTWGYKTAGGPSELHFRTLNATPVEVNGWSTGSYVDLWQFQTTGSTPASGISDVVAGPGVAVSVDVDGVATVSLAPSGVTPGSYTNTDASIDTYGRVTDAANGTGGGSGTVTSVTAGSGLTGTPNPIVGAGTIALRRSILFALTGA